MRENAKTIFVGVVTLVSIGTFCLIFIHATLYAPSDEASSNILSFAVEPAKAFAKQVIPKEKPNPLYPARLTIPTLHVDAKVQDVGLTSKGNMATPNNFTDVGWYEYGAVPGTTGSAVIAGHIDNGLALPGVFKNLGDLKTGDDIYVENGNGETTHFVVSNLTTYDYNAHIDSVFADDSGKYLKLITCAGVWVDSYHTHDKRLVVTAVETT